MCGKGTIASVCDAKDTVAARRAAVKDRRELRDVNLKHPELIHLPCDKASVHRAVISRVIAVPAIVSKHKVLILIQNDASHRFASIGNDDVRLEIQLCECVFYAAGRGNKDSVLFDRDSFSREADDALDKDILPLLWLDMLDNVASLGREQERRYFFNQEKRVVFDRGQHGNAVGYSGLNNQEADEKNQQEDVRDDARDAAEVSFAVRKIRPSARM